MGLIELSLWDKLKRIKADKVVGAVEGNFAKLDANGNLVDSGHNDADYEDADTTILKEADVVDSLDSTSTKAPLSANQGKVLKDAVDEVEGRVDETQASLLTTKLAVNELERQAQIGNGATLDFSDVGTVPLDARATGRANPTVEGRTATNLLTNGDFSQGETGWSDVNSKFTVVDGKAVFAGHTVPVPFGQSNKLIESHVYVVLFNAVPSNSPSIGIYNGVSFPVPIGSYSIISGLNVIRFTNSSSGTSFMTGWGANVGAGTTVDNFILLDLTSIYGSGNEPSEADCAKIFSYFDGTKSIQLPARVRSVGKNLFDVNTMSIKTYYYMDNDGVERYMGNANYDTTFRPVVPSTTYIWQGNKMGGTNINGAVYFYDRGRNWISRITGFFDTPSQFTTPANCHFIQLQFGGVPPYADNDFASWQINLGSTATPYEPYTDSTLYIADNEEVRSVPAISDEVKVVNGQLVKVQNVQRYVLQESDVVLILDLVDQPNITIARVDILDIIIAYSSLGRVVAIGKIEDIFSAYKTIDDVGKFSRIGSTARLYFYLTKGTTIAQAKADLAGTVIYYQLATPIITPILTSGILQAKPNGTVYFEPYYEGSHQTDASSQITLPYTGTIDKVTGYDENLEPYEVPSTAYTLVGTLLTITGAVENEVFYVELSRSEPIAPEMSVNVINNEQVIADTENGKFYKLVPTITDGVLVSQTPVEVV